MREPERGINKKVSPTSFCPHNNATLGEEWIKNEHMELGCHYTTLETFLEMLKQVDWNKKSEDRTLTFWASNIHSMNDPQEFIYGYRLLQNTILPDIEKELGISDNEQKLSKIGEIWGYKDIEKLNNTIIEHIYKEQKSPFIVSFSKDKDSLPMWNMYADNGNGVCLCFINNEDLLRPIDNINIDINFIYRLHAMEVGYGDVKDTIRNTVRRLYKGYYKGYQKYDIEMRKQEMLRHFVDLAVTISPYHKNEAYRFEDEVRLVEFKKNADDVKYRTSKRGRLIPYIEISIKLQYLWQIIIGPCADSPSIIRELRNILSRNMEIRDDFIIPSKIPYREY